MATTKAAVKARTLRAKLKAMPGEKRAAVIAAIVEHFMNDPGALEFLAEGVYSKVEDNLEDFLKGRLTVELEARACYGFQEEDRAEIERALRESGHGDVLGDSA